MAARFFTLHLLFISLFLCSGILRAADINLSISQESIGRDVSVTIHNQSAVPVTIVGVDVGFAGKTYTAAPEQPIQPQSSATVKYLVDFPSLPGSYALSVLTRYLNDGQILSLATAGIYNYQTNRIASATLSIPERTLVTEGVIEMAGTSPEKWRLLWPSEVSILDDKTERGIRSVKIRGNIHGFNNRYPLYAIYEEVRDNYHYTAIVDSRFTLDVRNNFSRGATPDAILLAGLSLGLAVATVIFFRKGDNKGLWETAIGKYAVRLFWLSASYYALRHAPILMAWLGVRIPPQFPFVLHLADFEVWNWRSFANRVQNHLNNSGNYGYFFTHFIDYYYWICAVICLPYSRFLDSEKALYQDKYTCFLRSLITLPVLLWDYRKWRWNYTARLGFLTLCVKWFYIPLITTWVINNIFHQVNLTNGLTATLISINAYLMALFILVDTAIFSFGYTVESKYLKNEMRSVEPTILGWTVCLWCYPPFNGFSFGIFDHQLGFNVALSNPPDWLTTTASILITLGWGIFAWASVALGFRASNLTNRGIVCRGPYRFCRHPAYTVKIMIWILEGVIFGRYFLGLMLGFALIYFLRGWTEERHLSRDPDYIAYKKKVRWRCIPGLF